MAVGKLAPANPHFTKPDYLNMNDIFEMKSNRTFSAKKKKKKKKKKDFFDVIFFFFFSM
jgi:hypothetical protein